MSQIEKEPDWTVDYYMELDPEKRQVILNEHIMEPLTEADEYRLENVIKEIQEICDGAITEEFPKKKSICKKCAYFDLCFI